ncbi:unnamed protein product [Phytophthora lilii]|uniref:Unnamed protein product n=1 Tax=Phytophthora lilii TaxID=2077276 RepID=A0A9W6TNK0_9STRA|nr:unnamed protein product [Phytophthora lilii]
MPHEIRLGRAVHRLALEGDALRTDNERLREKLLRYERLKSLTEEGLIEVGIVNVYQASKKSQRAPRPGAGWRVYFPDGEPSFYFFHLSRQEFDAAVKKSYDLFGADPPYIESVGTLLGWKVHNAPLKRDLESNSLVTHARFTIRINCSLDEANKSIVTQDLRSLPLIATPSNWSYNRRDEVCIQVLQEFEKDAYVMVCNVPGRVHCRFLFQFRRLLRILPNGKRSVSFIMRDANSTANKRSRAAEDPQPNVEWLREGGTFLKLTELDDSTIDLSYDHSASCHDEPHAQQLFIGWAQFLCRWSQKTLASKLLQ